MMSFDNVNDSYLKDNVPQFPSRSLNPNNLEKLNQNINQNLLISMLDQFFCILNFSGLISGLLLFFFLNVANIFVYSL